MRLVLLTAAALLAGCNAIFGIDELSYAGAGGSTATPSGTGGGGGGGGDSCFDGERSGGETGVDCGGTCPPCESALGEPCSADTDCDSGHCPPDDGVCCDTACALTCEACLGTKTGGEDGICDFVLTATDPDDECPVTTAESCGTNGMGCSGSLTACLLYDGNTVCEPSFCQRATFHETATCDGTGDCPPGATTSCHPYTCGSNACRTSCGAESHCVSTYWCQLVNGSCQPKLGPGASCTAAKQCLSNICNGGLCG